MEDSRPIGVFDSGLGGLTSVKEIMTQLPNESIIYFGDTGRVPYGTRSNEIITKYVMQDIRFLLKFNIKLIIIACGTASSVALQLAKEEFDIPIIGVVEPTANKAVKTTKNKKIGIIGTRSTINSNSYQATIDKIDPTIKTFGQACPLFVPLIENGYTNNDITTTIAKEYLNPLKEENIDTLIMGCTHYPLIKETIQKVIGNQVNLIDAGIETVKYAQILLTNKEILPNIKKEPIYKYFVSDDIDNFINIGGMFLGKEIKNNIKKIDIEKY